MALDPNVVDSVANANFKTLADTPANLNNLALQSAVNFQQAMNNAMIQGTQAFNAAMARQYERFASLDPAESIGPAAMGQVVSKVAGNTPPQSNP